MRRSDPADWMWAEACDLIDQAERLHRRFFHLNARSRVPWAPPVDMFEGDAEVVIVVAMPGVTSDRVEVSHEPGALVVRGERPLPFARERLAVRRLEIPYGAFERRIPLPSGRFESTAPELAQGCLLVRLRRIA
ncbi:MAG TPA: Hsp20/alpha crystallin family protein [Casimicrobiaceae bacterium]|jgi:HSP20 family molecular chaperone IbpA|nr:Hsp20/alpha crystallin family protein [Casimicrobiaceae bacterium]